MDQDKNLEKTRSERQRIERMVKGIELNVCLNTKITDEYRKKSWEALVKPREKKPDRTWGQTT